MCGTSRIWSGKPTRCASAGFSPRTNRSFRTSTDGEEYKSSREMFSGQQAIRPDLQRLREVSMDEWKRAGEQEGVGRVELSDVPRMMTEHDRMHGVEIADLVREIRDRIVPPAAMERRVSAVA